LAKVAKRYTIKITAKASTKKSEGFIEVVNVDSFSLPFPSGVVTSWGIHFQVFYLLELNKYQSSPSGVVAMGTNISPFRPAYPPFGEHISIVFTFLYLRHK